MKRNALHIRILVLDDNLDSVEGVIFKAIGNYLQERDNFPKFPLIEVESSPVHLVNLSQTPVDITFLCNRTEETSAEIVKRRVERGDFTGHFDLVLLDDNWPDSDTAGRDILLEPVAKNILGVSDDLPIISLFTIYLDHARLNAFYQVLQSNIPNWERVLPRDKNDELQLIDLFQRTIASKRIAEDRERLAEENRRLQQQLEKTCPRPDKIIGESSVMRSVYQNIRVVAPAPAKVLILGENGTGKELVARAIHDVSGRQEKPFVGVNCGAIPENLLESELFGYEKGSFTGATQPKMGLFEVAGEGTFFLDEIGELPQKLQVKLLRVLEEREFYKIGGTRSIKFMARVIAATNIDLKQKINEGTFRKELYYRINVFPITLPPLRERRDDIPALVNHFVKVKSEELGKQNLQVSDSAMNKLQSHSWVGNVRELENIIERAVLLSTSSKILPEHIHIEEQRQPRGDDSASLVPMNINIDKDKAGKALIYLEECEAIALSGCDVTHEQLAIRWGCAKSNVTQRIGLVKNEMKLILNHPPNSARWPRSRASGCFENWSILL